MIKSNNEKWVAWIPDNEDVGVFVCGIVLLLQEMELRRDHREKARCRRGRLLTRTRRNCTYWHPQDRDRCDPVYTTTLHDANRHGKMPSRGEEAP